MYDTVTLGMEYVYAIKPPSTVYLQDVEIPQDKWLLGHAGRAGELRWYNNCPDINKTGDCTLIIAQRTIKGDVQNKGENDCNLEKGKWSISQIFNIRTASLTPA